MPRACAPLDTPIGRHWVVVSPAGLLAVVRGELPPMDAELDADACAVVVAQLCAYFAGRLRAFSLPLDMAGASPFDRDVWQAARTVGYGATISYGELALLAAHPGAARAVGGAMARCWLTPVVPCHRVVHADGSHLRLGRGHVGQTLAAGS